MVENNFQKQFLILTVVHKANFNNGHSDQEPVMVFLGLVFTQHLSNKGGNVVQGWTAWKVLLSVQMTKEVWGFVFGKKPENFPLPFPPLMGSLLTEIQEE